MLTIAFPAAAFATNCYILATSAGEECLIIDPGIGVEDRIADILTQHRLRPAAVLLTHGHVDHTYAVTPVCGGGTAAYIHTGDRYRLTDPLQGIGPEMRYMLEQQFGRAATWTEPSDVVEVTDEQTLTLAGLIIGVLHAPGHTEGSAMFRLPTLPDGIGTEHDLTSTLISGDVLFAGSIGRTDLPGGDHGAMQRSLRDVVLPLPDPTLVLPGHGPATTIERERTTNPYLQNL